MRRGKMAKEKIVVIDDSPIVRKLAELALEEEGYKVYTAEDGEEGLRICEEVRPSVILVDFIMPRISGYQFCEAARDNELLKDIPIILITGKGEDVGKKFSEKFGVVDYFIKPFKSEILVEKVNAIIYSQRVAAEEEELRLEPQNAAAETEYDFYKSKSPEPAGFGTEGMSSEPVVAFEPVAAVDEIKTPQEEPVLYAEPVFSFDSPETEVVATDNAFETVYGATPEFSGAFDFQTGHDMLMQPSDFSAATTESVYTPEEPVAGNMDVMLRRYFRDELPLLIQSSVEDILRQYGIIKDSSILLSGNIQDVSGIEILKLISAQRLTGKFFVYSTPGSVEIYFDKGLVVFALTSQQGKTLTSKRVAIIRKGSVNETGERTKESIIDALIMVAGFREGGFFFEKMAVPKAMLELNQRGNITALVLEGLRKKGESAAAVGAMLIPVRSVSEASAVSFGMSAEENTIFLLVDGNKSITDIAQLSGLGVTQVSKILNRLEKAGVVADKGGL
jgi:CheY-like chemotaxis protein